MDPKRVGRVIILSERKSPELSTLLTQVDSSFRVQEIQLDSRASLNGLEELSRPNVVVMNYSDLTDAIELVRAIRQRDEAKPILVVTSEQDVDVILRAYRAGVNDCIDSTISPALLLAKIRVWLRWLGNLI